MTITIQNVKPSYLVDDTQRAIVGQRACADVMNQVGAPKHACRLSDYRSNSEGVQIVL